MDDGRIKLDGTVRIGQKPFQFGGVNLVKPPVGKATVTEMEIREEELLQRASQGDSEAFGMLYERYVRRIFNYVYYRTGNIHDAEDLTARVFQRALKHIHRYTDRGLPFSAWLYRIAHNLVANWHRDHSHRQEIPLDDVLPLPTPHEPPEAVLMRLEEQQTLLRVIRRLPPDRQHLLILKFVEDLSNAEIGRIMGRSEGAVKSLYHRTLLSLRAYLTEEQADLPEGEGDKPTISD